MAKKPSKEPIKKSEFDLNDFKERVDVEKC